MTLEINRLYKDKLEAKYAEIERLRGVLQEIADYGDCTNEELDWPISLALDELETPL